MQPGAEGNDTASQLPPEHLSHEESSLGSGTTPGLIKAQEGICAGEENVRLVSVRQLGDSRPPPQLTVKDVNEHAAARRRAAAGTAASARRNVGDSRRGPWAEQLSQCGIPQEKGVAWEWRANGLRRSGSGLEAARVMFVLLLFAAALGRDPGTPGGQGWSAMHRLIKREVRASETTIRERGRAGQSLFPACAPPPPPAVHPEQRGSLGQSRW